MPIDFQTLFFATGFITEVGGLMLLFSWLQDRRSTALAYWGAAYSIAAIGGLLFGMRATLPISLAINLGGMLTMLGFGLMWCGARSSEGPPAGFPARICRCCAMGNARDQRLL